MFRPSMRSSSGKLKSLKFRVLKYYLRDLVVYIDLKDCRKGFILRSTYAEVVLYNS